MLPQVTTFILEGEQRVYRDSRDKKVVISGPANFRAVSDQKLILNSGKVSVFLDDSTNGFMVETPQTLVEDLGTAFGCFVDGETTEIHVFDGVVQFGVERHKLSARNAVAVERQKWEEIPYDRTLFSINSQLVPELQKVNLKVGEILYLSTKGVNEIKGSVNFKKLNHDRPRFEVLYGAEMVNAERFREDQNPMPFSFGIMSNSIGLRLNGRGNDYVTSELVVTLDEYPYMLPQELISAESTWSYLKPGKSMAADWHSDAAEIRNWQQGKGGIGFGRKVNTLLEEDDAPLYLSKSFDADEVPENSQLLLSSILDDGGIIYLNGHEIYRNNYDGAGLSPDARSHTRRGTEREHFYETVRLPSDKLKIGKNIISVVLCQYEKRSGDMYFDLILKLANQIE
ncbi:MAG: FecR family protein [Lentisphaeraceae bacterium]|nr:FecR family protein [Lentisphaeraceae bacterium]